jgi:1,2-diacylglycerol 3-alpha-glucosyltransferase
VVVQDAFKFDLGRADNEHPRWLRHVGLVNDYVRIPHANGSSFASQWLYRELRARGHEVTVVGPSDPLATPEEMPEAYELLRSLPLRTLPGVRLPFPSREALTRIAARRFDLVLGQAGSELADLGVYLRATQHVPFLCVNTLHLRTVYNVVLSDKLYKLDAVQALFEHGLMPWLETQAARIYNQTDGLIVLSSGLEEFWRRRGVRCPIHVIPRAVDPQVFDAPAGSDPFDARAPKGERLLVVCRHSREKGVARLIRMFARHVAPVRPKATLTLVGDGPDQDSFRALAEELGVAGRTFFPGEFSLRDVPRFYHHADLFVYASLSETYGQVVSEALWCGLPVVALSDGMGVSDQVSHGQDGYLVKPELGEHDDDAAFAAHVLRLLQQPGERHALGLRARQRVRQRVHPRRIMQSYYSAFESGREHCRGSLSERIKRPATPYVSVGRWASVQALAIALGQLRAPGVVNRHGRRPPGWDAVTRQSAE